ncbi:MAG: RNA methyltransferase [Microthrixaceae bacterium]
MQHIDNAADVRLSDYCNLTDAAVLRDGFFIVEGVLALRQVLELASITSPAIHAMAEPAAPQAKYSIRSVLLTTNKAVGMAEEIDICMAQGISIYTAPKQVLAEVAGFDVHRGVLASVCRPVQPELHSVLRTAQSLVLLEGVNDHENIGSIFRNAAALGIDAVVLDARCSDPLYRRSVRVSLGHVLRMPWCRTEELSPTLHEIHQAGFCSIGLTPVADALAVDKAVHLGILQRPFALLLGAEGSGLTTATLHACDHRVRIPMSYGTDSLNVATSLAVVASFAAAENNWSS